jgi:hypothetical protein
MPRGFLFLTLGFALACAVGCSKGSGGRVKGQVLLDAKPVDGANVMLVGKDKSPAAFSGKTDANGNFDITGTPDRPLPLGSYQVLITKFVDKKTGKEPSADDYGQLEAQGALRNELPRQYGERGSSKLTAEVKEGETVLQPFDLKK